MSVRCGLFPCPAVAPKLSFQSWGYDREPVVFRLTASVRHNASAFGMPRSGRQPGVASSPARMRQTEK